MFVIRELSAVHAIRLFGELEPLHGHDFRITARFASDRDPEELARPLDAALASVARRDLAELTRPLGSLASAEAVARALFDRLAGRGLGVVAVSVGEAPGCTASYTGPGSAT